jgi:hypothetical protein
MERTLTAPDGATLLVRDWSPAGTPWAHLLLVHGVAEHAGRYDRTGRLLADAGVALTGYDHRGHGGSSGARGHVDDWGDLTADVGHVLADVRTAAAGRSVGLLAHSMGGLVALDAVLAGSAAPDLLVLSAPGIDDDLPRWQHAVAPLIARIAPTVRIRNAWGEAMLSRDPEVGRRAATDPLNLDRVSVRLGAGGFGAQERVRAAIGSLDRAPMPILVLHGEDDRLVPPRATEALGRVPGVTRRTYPGLRHELLNEPEGPSIVSEIVAWLREAIAGG